jgi:adenylylsulfate kinase
MIVLICGLSGSGKTTIADSMNVILKFHSINGDEIRKIHNDWDFSVEGRLRQAKRIKEEAAQYKDVIVDAIFPLHRMRTILAPDFTIFMDTKRQSKYHDTDKMFERPILPNVTLVEVPPISTVILITERIKERQNCDCA